MININHWDIILTIHTPASSTELGFSVSASAVLIPSISLIIQAKCNLDIYNKII